MPKIDDSLYLSNQQSRGVPNPDLGKDEFINILMTQLQNQDPLNPMEDKDFIAQMATFSSLEQMMNMTSSIDRLVQNQIVSPVIQYSHMIGKEVAYEFVNEEGTKEIGNSEVKSVSQKDGYATLGLANGETIYTDEVVKVSINDGVSNE